jgi:GDPmannose 4,6-dehydratase
MKTALIFGVTGQDGYYLSKLLLDINDYTVIGVKRRSSSDNTSRLHSLLSNKNFILVEGDVTDISSVHSLLTSYDPSEVYNLAAQSHVQTSFEQPAYTTAVNFNGVLNILECLRKFLPAARFYQASTSEMFGDNASRKEVLRTEFGMANVPYWEPYQDENTAFSPMSPYAVAKCAAHQLVNNYRKAYSLHACCGILFNHESPLRGDNFVTQKIAKYVGGLQKRIKGNAPYGAIDKLQLGNLEAKRDWGHAADYVKAMWLMLQEPKPDDYVIATGETHSVREFCELAFDRIDCKWTDWVESNQAHFRPSEVPYLLGKADKARAALNWKPEVTFQQLVNDMVDAQL